MKTIRNQIAAVALATVVATGLLALGAPSSAHARSSGGFNDEYIFAATKGVDDMDMHPAWKLPLFPVTVVVDIASLPFAVIAGFVG